MSTQTQAWECPKCANRTFDSGELRGEGGGWSTFLDINTRRFNFVSCERCGYTEFYKANADTVSKLVDLLGGG